MFDGIPEDRLLNMTDPERRLLNNIKRALYDSDQALIDHRKAAGSLHGRTL
jgi:hypothetical protein